MLLKEFVNLFEKASLTEEEKNYFLEDAKEAIQIIDCNSVSEYYNWSETKYCLIKYAKPEYKDAAISGLNKILNIITK